MANGDLMDLQEVIDSLGMGEQELQNLVAQGKLKAVRAGRTIKFRREEVMGLKSGRSTEPTIIIPTQEAAPAPVPAMIDESAATVVPEAPAGGVVPVETQEISLDDDELEIVPLEDEAAATVAESAPVAADEELTIAEEYEEAAPARRPSARSGRGSRMSRRVSQGAYAAPPTSPMWAGVLIITTVLLLLAGSVFGTIYVKGYTTEEGARYVPGYLDWAYSLFSDEENAP